MINEGLGKYLQTTWVTFPRFPHFYALASLRLSTKDDGKKEEEKKILWIANYHSLLWSVTFEIEQTPGRAVKSK